MKNKNIKKGIKNTSFSLRGECAMFRDWLRQVGGQRHRWERSTTDGNDVARQTFLCVLFVLFDILLTGWHLSESTAKDPNVQRPSQNAIFVVVIDVVGAAFVVVVGFSRVWYFSDCWFGRRCRDDRGRGSCSLFQFAAHRIAFRGVPCQAVVVARESVAL